MLSIIIVFPNINDANNIKNILLRNSYDVSAACVTGAQAISIANELDEGIVICGYKLPDMMYHELNGYLPKGFEMLLIASAAKIKDNTDGSIVSLCIPFKVNDFLNTIGLMTHNYMKRKKRERLIPKKRSNEQQEIINRAKMLLMERNNMSEEDAYRYIQKVSMDSGTNMVEMAEMILTMM